MSFARISSGSSPMRRRVECARHVSMLCCSGALVRCGAGPELDDADASAAARCAIHVAPNLMVILSSFSLS